ncbi:MAG: hypothetical protein NTY19_03130, partial [Planctomycetota bacterium]|nr:hypothetical protein [Planctomycetota bacterium]
PRDKSTDPSPLKIKEVWVDERRYVVCLNEEQAKKDRADREAIVAALREQLRHGDRSLVGNKGYRKFLSAEEGPNLNHRMQMSRRWGRRRGFVSGGGHLIRVVMHFPVQTSDGGH